MRLWHPLNQISNLVAFRDRLVTQLAICIFGLNMSFPTKALVFPLLALLITSCASLPERKPIPAEMSDKAAIPGISASARSWADQEFDDEETLAQLTTNDIRDSFPALIGQPLNLLAISGGGPRGAFAAGLLNGWSAAGTRPDFALVTGVSTGALIAPFAFLGSDYDHALKEIYTKYSTDDLLKKRSIIKTITGDAAADTAPLRSLLADYVDEDLVAAIAAEYRKGKSLYIITTNLDAMRGVRWDIGYIASSGLANAAQIIRDVMLASASIPGAFPPVMFTVEAEGKLYDEMHVDGAVSTNMYLYPIEFNARKFAELVQAEGTPTAYIIKNGFSRGKWESVERKTIPIAMRTIQAFFGTVSSGDVYRLYLETARDGIDYRLAFIPETFEMEHDEPFDPKYMKMLFNLGYEMAKDGYEWEVSAPDFEEGKE